MSVIEDRFRPRVSDEVAELEALWEAPAARPRARRRRSLEWMRRPLGFLWGAVLVSLFLAPAPEGDVAIPAWSWVLFGAFAFAVVGMFAAFALGGLGLALGASLVAGALGRRAGCRLPVDGASPRWLGDVRAGCVCRADGRERGRARGRQTALAVYAERATSSGLPVSSSVLRPLRM